MNGDIREQRTSNIQHPTSNIERRMIQAAARPSAADFFPDFLAS